MATFDGNGLVIDRLADIKTEMETELRDAFGQGINLADTSPWGLIVGILAERYSLVWELLESVYNASFPNTAFGVYLEELVAFNGLTREPATSSAVGLTFTRSTAQGSGNVTIPIGTQVTATSGATTIWSTTVEATILSANLTVAVSATANTVGPIGALTGTLTTMVAAPPNVLSVTNPANATLGELEETDAELKARRNNQLGRAGTSTESGIRSALQLMDEVRKATLISNDTDLTVDSRPPHSFEAYVATEAEFNVGQISTLTFDADLVTSNSIAITLDGSPIAASPVVFVTDHEATMDAIAAAILAESLIAVSLVDELDDQEIDITGATAADVVITAVVTGGASQATGTWVEVLPAGDTLTAIAQKIWDSKAAGIQTVGLFTGIAVDTAAGLHSVSFSVITDIELLVRFTLTTDTNYDAAVAEPAIQQALFEYAENNLTAGVDVLTYKLLCAASDVGAAGIIGLVCEIAKKDGGAFSVANIAVGVNEFATIAVDDVTFI